MDKPKFQFTKDGFKNLEKELEALIKKRPDVVKRLSEAREQGDLSENAGYHASKEELGKTDSRIRELKYLIRFGEVVEATGAEIVSFGCKVKVHDGKFENEFIIVNHMEADPKSGKMSDISPIGSALLGKKVGDEVEIEVPSGKVNYRILEIQTNI